MGPYINSYGISLRTTRSEGWDWNPKETFGLIIDVWNEYWNDEISTVHPKSMVEKAEEYVNDEGKVIVHFIQPHKPFLTSKEGRVLDGDAMLKRKTSKFKKKRDFILKLAKPIIPLWLKLSEKKRFKMKKVLGTKLTKKIGIRTTKVHKRYYFEGKTSEIRNYYKQNLELALRYLSKLVQKIPSDKKVIVTSDHGEAFGESDLFGHMPNMHVPVLIEVPWLELYGEADIRSNKANEKLNQTKRVEKIKKNKSKNLYPNEEKNKIKDRLEDLGYL